MNEWKTERKMATSIHLSSYIVGKYILQLPMFTSSTSIQYTVQVPYSNLTKEKAVWSFTGIDREEARFMVN